jgi:hypothetical protein
MSPDSFEAQKPFLQHNRADVTPSAVAKILRFGKTKIVGEKGKWGKGCIFEM